MAGIQTMPILFFLMCLVAMFLSLFRPPIHALLIDLPIPTLDGTVTRADSGMLVLTIGVLRDGRPTFNGTPVSHSMLVVLLSEAARLPHTPGVRFEPSPDARYETVLPVLGIIKATGLAEGQFCFGGLETHRRFDKGAIFEPLYLTMRLDPITQLAVPSGPAECDPGSLPKPATA